MIRKIGGGGKFKGGGQKNWGWVGPKVNLPTLFQNLLAPLRICW